MKGSEKREKGKERKEYSHKKGKEEKVTGKRWLRKRRKRGRHEGTKLFIFV